MRLIARLRILNLCLLFFAASCTIPAKEQITLSSTPESPSPVSSPVPLASTPTPSPAPSPTTTMIATQTVTPTIPPPPPTLTPLPTLPVSEAKELAEELLQNNAGCRLPCWWGFTPGQTSWDTAQRYLSTFASQIDVTGNSENPRYANVIIPVSKKISPAYLRQYYTIRNGVIASIGADPGYMQVYHLASILKDYGVPGEIWIRTYQEGYKGELPFQIALFYPQEGFMAGYAFTGDVKGLKVQGCPIKGTRPLLGMWPPGQPITFNDATEMFRLDNKVWPFRILSEATGMDVNTFYKTFIDPSSSQCLETPRDLWQPVY
jgi:hypothetical protein